MNDPTVYMTSKSSNLKSSNASVLTFLLCFWCLNGVACYTSSYMLEHWLKIFVIYISPVIALI